MCARSWRQPESPGQAFTVGSPICTAIHNGKLGDLPEIGGVGCYDVGCCLLTTGLVFLAQQAPPMDFAAATEPGLVLGTQVPSDCLLFVE